MKTRRGTIKPVSSLQTIQFDGTLEKPTQMLLIGFEVFLMVRNNNKKKHET